MINRDILADLVFENILNQIKTSAACGNWSMRMHGLDKRHAEKLIGKGLKIDPLPTQENYDRIASVIVSWK